MYLKVAKCSEKEVWAGIGWSNCISLGLSPGSSVHIINHRNVCFKPEHCSNWSYLFHIFHFIYFFARGFGRISILRPLRLQYPSLSSLCPIIHNFYQSLKWFIFQPLIDSAGQHPLNHNPPLPPHHPTATGRVRVDGSC